MSIPIARAKLRDVALRLFSVGQSGEADEILNAVDLMYRRSAIKRAAPRARKITPEISRSVRTYFRENPTASNREIGQRFGIDGGRVSEILHGLR
jgi:hypothetical protein